jgi:hypothetical protein
VQVVLDMRTHWIIWATSLAYGLIAQTTLINPTTDGGFEGSHGWTLVNSTDYPNRWCVGSAAPPSEGSNCLFISDASDCSRYRYSGTGGNRSFVHAYKEINVPANQPYLTISFKAKLNGGGFHRAIFYLMPSTIPLPQADVEISRQYRLFDIHSSSSGTIDKDGYIVSPTAYTSVSHVTCVEPGQAYRLVISGYVEYTPLDSEQPPASIDEVSVVSSATPSDPPLGGGVIAVSNLPYTHPTTPTPTTCGSGNDLFGFNVKSRCGIQGDAFDNGKDRVWTFIPTRGGCVRVQFTGDTLNGYGWINMKLLIYEDNPLSCGQCIRKSEFQEVHTHIFRVQPNHKYYVVLESGGGENNTGCDDFLGLTISAPDSNLCALASLPLSAQGVREFTVYPNPASDVIQVRAAGLEGGRAAALCVRDGLGRSLIEVQTFPTHEGEISYTLGIAQLPAGFYIVEIQQGESYARQRLTIAP